MDLKKNIGRLIAHARIIKGLTQKQLAERIGVSESAIGNYEASGRLPETSILILLCKELDLLPVELFSGKRFHNAEARKELLKMLNESTGKIEMPNEEESTEPSKKMIKVRISVNIKLYT